AVKHPRRNLKQAIGRRTCEVAPKNNPPGAFHGLMHVDRPTPPGVPLIDNFPDIGPVGVASPCCTMNADCIPLWAI
ncbi:hypothetical protein, partial [Sphingobium aromaticivastans]|uniref:hypothetical protein n=1 Tax=Sphingobium aromaticivastans TaxID=1778665 RepID=UPI003017F194